MRLLACGRYRIGVSESGRSKSAIVYLICILGLAGLVGLLLAKNQTLQKEAAKSQSLANEVHTLQQQVGELAGVREENQKLQELRKDPQELLRLRSEVNTLRAARDQAAKLQAEVAQLRASLQQLQSSAAAANTLRTQNEQLQGALAAQQQSAAIAACAENLRQIQAAKIAWARDNNRQLGDIPQDIELFGPNRYIPQKPKCPSGGNYTTGPVQQQAGCSFPGHSQ